MANKRKREGPAKSVKPEICERVTRAAAIRDATGEWAIDDANHRMWFHATSADRCDDNMAIDATAWERDMPAHVSFVDSHARTTIKLIYGKVVAARFLPDGLYEQVEFAADVIHPDGQLAWYLYRNGYASDVSIAWTTLEHEKRKDADDREYIGVTRARQEELSGCIIGLDPKAEAMHTDSGLMVLARQLSNLCDGTGDDEAVLAEGAVDDTAVDGKDASEERGERPGWEETDEWIHYRIRPPGDFQEDTYVILSLDVKGTKDVQIKRARYTGDADDGKRHAQAIQFEIAAGWGTASAKEWWADHKEELSRSGGDLETWAYCTSLLTEIRGLRATCAALLIRLGERDAISMAPKVEESAHMKALRRMAESILLTPDEVMERLTQQGS